MKELLQQFYSRDTRVAQVSVPAAGTGSRVVETRVPREGRLARGERAAGPGRE